MPKRQAPQILRGSQSEDWVETILPAEGKVQLNQDLDKRPLKMWLAYGILALALLGGRLFQLQVLKGEYNLNLANGNRLRQQIIHAPRGVITDRSGTVLVKNIPAYDVIITPGLLPKQKSARQAVFEHLAEMLSIKPVDIQKIVEDKNAQQNQSVLVAGKVERERALNIDQELANLPGVYLEVNPVREYIDPSLAHILGYPGRVTKNDLIGSSYALTDYIGKTGIEKYYENKLRGQNGAQQIEVDSLGRPSKIIARKDAVAGQNLVLTIDGGLQKKLTQELSKSVEKAEGRGAAVALNPKTGEILAAVSLPGYDNNLFAKGISTSDYQQLLANENTPLINRFAGGTYPVGSIIKPIIAAAALENKVVTAQTQITDNGFIEVTNPYNSQVKYRFRGWNEAGLGPVNIYSALALSSDIYFYTVGGGFADFVGLGVDKLTNYYQRFGLGRLTGIDLPGEAAGVVPNPAWKQKNKKESWYVGDTYNISIGQGDLLATPLQMAMATAAIADGGNLRQPYLVKSVTNSAGKLVSALESKIITEHIASDDTLKTIKAAMRKVVTEGTACCVMEQQVGVAVAGKTGTAETDPEKKKPHAWFSAFAPYDDPKIAIVVLVENSGEGAEFAVPVVRETLAWYFAR